MKGGWLGGSHLQSRYAYDKFPRIKQQTHTQSIAVPRYLTRGKLTFVDRRFTKRIGTPTFAAHVLFCSGSFVSLIITRQSRIHTKETALKRTHGLENLSDIGNYSPQNQLPEYAMLRTLLCTDDKLLKWLLKHVCVNIFRRFVHADHSLLMPIGYFYFNLFNPSPSLTLIENGFTGDSTQNE